MPPVSLSLYCFATRSRFIFCNSLTASFSFAFSSKVIFETTDVVVGNSNFSFTAEHDYTDFDANKTNVTQYYGFFNINNTNVALNSSDFVVTGPNPRQVDKSLYDDHTYADLFPSMKFSYVDISVKDSNTTYTAHPYSTSDNSNINFINLPFSIIEGLKSLRYMVFPSKTVMIQT